MHIEARSPSCFSNTYVLKVDGSSVGRFRGRFFSGNVEIRLTGRGVLHLEKRDFWGSTFALRGPGGDLLAGARRAGVLTSAWDLELACGSAELVSAGLFNSSYRVLQGSLILADIDRVGLCEGGWEVRGQSHLTMIDGIFVGLIYHTIVRRQAATAAAAGGAS